MRAKDRGLSLIEVLCTLVLVGLVLVMVSNVTRTLSTANTVSKRVSTLRETAKSAMMTLRRDIQAAAEVLDPSSDPSRLDLVMWKTEHLLPGTVPGTRLPSPPRTNASAWPIRHADFVEAKSYFLDSGEFKRQTEAEPAVALFEAEEFRVTLANEVYTVTLKFDIDNKPSTTLLKVSRF